MVTAKHRPPTLVSVLLLISRRQPVSELLEPRQHRLRRRKTWIQSQSLLQIGNSVDRQTISYIAAPVWISTCAALNSAVAAIANIGAPERYFLKGGSSSVAERQLPKLNVAGSIPVSRSI